MKFYTKRFAITFDIYKLYLFNFVTDDVIFRY